MIRLRVLRALHGNSPFRQNLVSFLADSRAKNFTKENFQFPERITEVLDQSHPRVDPFILHRKPEIIFEMKDNEKVVAINSLYKPADEIRFDNAPYAAFARSLFELISITKPRRVIDIGCTSGNLINEILRQYPNLQVAGIEMFEFLKDAASSEVRDLIHIKDLRFPISNIDPFDLVIFTEVGEHIDPSLLDIFLDNIVKLCNGYLVLSWSSTYPNADAPPQHIAPLPSHEIHKLLPAWGFTFQKDLSQTLAQVTLSEEAFHSHWRQSLSVWKIDG